MAQLDPLGIMDADLDSCVPTDIITSSDKLGEELRPLRPPGVPPASGRLALVSGEVFLGFLRFSLCKCLVQQQKNLLCSSGAQDMELVPRSQTCVMKSALLQPDESLQRLNTDSERCLSILTSSLTR